MSSLSPSSLHIQQHNDDNDNIVALVRQCRHHHHPHPCTSNNMMVMPSNMAMMMTTMLPPCNNVIVVIAFVLVCPHSHPCPCALDNTTTAAMMTLLPLCDSVIVVATLVTLILMHPITRYPTGIPTVGGYKYGYGSPGAAPIRKSIPTYRVWVFTGYGYRYSSQYLGVYLCYSLLPIKCRFLKQIYGRSIHCKDPPLPSLTQLCFHKPPCKFSVKRVYCRDLHKLLVLVQDRYHHVFHIIDH